MWCPTCQADVAAELTPDQRRLLCARCHTELALSATDPTRPGSVRVSDAERTARDLLARWSADSIVDVVKPSEIHPPEPQTPASIPVFELPRPVSETSSQNGGGIEHRSSRRRRLPRTVAAQPLPKTWTSTMAQCVAYGGVAGITYGAALILWSHFGGPEHYAPSGWLLATVGQMLLFLGLVTLVAGHLERYSEQLDRRFGELAERLDRAENHRRRKRRPADNVTARAA